MYTQNDCESECDCVATERASQNGYTCVIIIIVCVLVFGMFVHTIVTMTVWLRRELHRMGTPALSFFSVFVFGVFVHT